MNDFVDFAPISPLVLAQLASAAAAHVAPDPSRAVTRVTLDDRPTERSIPAPDKVSLGVAVDAYM